MGPSAQHATHIIYSDGKSTGIISKGFPSLYSQYSIYLSTRSAQFNLSSPINLRVMENYFTFTQLLGIRDHNLPPFRDVRLQRYKSVQRMMDLIQIATKTTPQPGIPHQVLILDSEDPEWDDAMPFPKIDFTRYVNLGMLIGTGLLFYSYNYNIFTNNIRYRSMRHFFPICLGLAFGTGYYSYRRQVLKINLFDEYCYMRAQELVNQNEYLVHSPDFKKMVFWRLDLEETMGKIYRNANDNQESDFKDSELILQDFINRYVDPNDESPMKNFSSVYSA